MRELSLHVLDIAENGIRAGADRICVIIDEQRRADRLCLTISDNGSGIAPDSLERVTDPFYTSRTTRRVGLGLSLLKAAAERCGGSFRIASEPGKGSRIEAVFQYHHIDRAPVGDMATTISLLIAGHQEVDFYYRHQVEDDQFTIDTLELKEAMKAMTLNQPAMILELTDVIRKHLSALEPDSDETLTRSIPNGETDNRRSEKN